MREPSLDSVTGQPRLTLLSRFSCQVNVRTSVKSQELVVGFPANNLLELTIFKGFRFLGGSMIQPTVNFVSSKRIK